MFEQYISRDRVVQLCPPVRPYIKKSFEGILMYDLACGYINKYFDYADPTKMYNTAHLEVCYHRILSNTLFKHQQYYLVWNERPDRAMNPQNVQSITIDDIYHDILV